MLAPFIAALMLTAGQAATQSPEPQTIGPEQLKAAIDRLGAFDAYAQDPRVREAFVKLVLSGQNLFRSAVIEAAGDYHVAAAFDSLMQVAKIDGPLQEDAVLALGKLGDKRALEVLAGLQRTAPRVRQPAIAAAICLLGINCGSHQGYLVETLTFAVKNLGYQDLLRAAARGLGALAATGHEDAAAVLIETGAPARDPARAPIAL